jgi:hypothetical protein
MFISINTEGMEHKKWMNIFRLIKSNANDLDFVLWEKMKAIKKLFNGVVNIFYLMDIPITPQDANNGECRI